MPGFSDHEVVFLETKTQANRHKPVRRKILLWNQADLSAIRSDIKTWSSDFTKRHTTSTPVETIAVELHNKLTETIETHVPSKMSSVRCNQPWFNTHAKRACRRKARAHKKARRTNQQRDWDYFRRKKRDAQQTCRQVYNKYLTNLVSSAADGNKRLGALVKSKRRDQLGVAPLKDGNQIHPDPRTKANLLNRQFASVFVQDDGITTPAPWVRVLTPPWQTSL
jgi:hypothetical protein